MTQRLYRPLVFFLIPVLLIWGLVGCTSDSIGGSSSPVARLTPCNNAATTFYQTPQNFNSLLSIMISFPSDPNVSSKERADSLTLLVHEVMRWSVQHDIKVDDVTYRFTVTLVSPELISSVVMAEFADHGRSYSDALTELNLWIQKRQANQQILFLLTINSSDQATLTEPDKQAIRVPISDMVLTTMSGLRTSQPQGEGIFGYDLDSYDGPIQYYFYFPTAVLVGDVCTPLLDPDRDLTFTLGINTAEINGKPAGNLYWNFDLARLINIGREMDPVCDMPIPTQKSNLPSETNLAGDLNYWFYFSLCAWETIAGIP
jgi:hypothetical protein